MTNQLALRRYVTIGIVMGVLALIVWALIPSKPKTLPPGACSTTTNMCIAMVNQQGTILARFNDFRFGQNNCVYYRATVYTPWQTYCGQYTLKWIGPNS